jgi:SAM-dependent methyltransferase
MATSNVPAGAGVKADHYYGTHATNYEARRASTTMWLREHQAVADFVTKGPVLDCPVGTGRYIPVYRAKGLDFMGVDISADMLAEARKRDRAASLLRASIFDLPFDPGAFSVAVATRMFHWLDPRQVAAAIGELRRVSSTLVLSMITGQQNRRDSGTWVHAPETFYQAFDGLHIARRRPLSSDGSNSMVLLRKALWTDVLAQFADRSEPDNPIERLVAIWAARMGVNPVRLQDGAVRAEYWAHDRFSAMLERMAAAVPDGLRATFKKTNPRRMDQPVTVVRTQGVEFLIDGRRRAYLWSDRPGVYPALVIEV